LQEKNCYKLNKSILNRNYTIKPSLVFLAFKPVKREIFAGDFSDRIIHHLVYDKLNYFCDSLLINDCFSCRKNRRIRKNFFNSLRLATRNQGSIDTINSYLGMIKNYNSYNLRKKYLESETGKLALKVLKAKVNKDYTKIEKEF
jgi:hypothetical protein